MKKLILFSSCIVLIVAVSAQNTSTSKGVFRFYEPGYYQNSILKGIEKYESTQETVKPTATFKLDPTGLFIPTDKSVFKSI